MKRSVPGALGIVDPDRFAFQTCLPYIEDGTGYLLG